MTQKVYSVDNGNSEEVRTNVRLAIVNAGGERIDTDIPNGAEVYHLADLRASIVYNGLRRVHIASESDVLIRKTESKLEGGLGLKLRELK